jgi:hypothetical protein
VITNRGDKQPIQLQVEAKAMDLTLDADSVTTLLW